MKSKFVREEISHSIKLWLAIMLEKGDIKHCDKYDAFETSVNNGYCHCLALMVQQRLKSLNIKVDIVQSTESGHWFLRYKDGETYYYFDAWMINGTDDLFDVVDRDLDTIVVRDYEWLKTNISNLEEKMKIISKNFPLDSYLIKG